MTLRVLMVSASLVGLVGCGGGSGGGSSPAPSGGGGGSSSNTAPRVTSATSFTFPEDQEVVFDVTVTDADGDNVTITIDGTIGDGSLFTINSSNGEVRANTDTLKFDFENPQDQNTDNVYQQTISLSDGTNTASETFTVTITDVDDPPTCESGQVFDVQENTSGVIFQLVGSDPEGEEGIFSITENTLPQDLLGNITVDSQTGEVSLMTGLDFEAVQSPTLNFDARFNQGGFSVNCGSTLNVVDVPSTIASGLIIEGEQSAANTVGDILGSASSEDLWVSNVATGFDGLSSAYLVASSNIEGPLTAGGAGKISLNTSTTAPIYTFTADFIDQNGVLVAPVLKAEGMGDLDGDGFDEFVILQATTADGETNIGATLIWGGQLALASPAVDINLSNLPEGLGLSLVSSENSGAGGTFGRLGSIATADINNDGVKDLVLGYPFYILPFENPNSGWSSRTYIISGQALTDAGSGIWDMDQQIPEEVMIFGDRSNDLSGGGFSVSVIADTTDDNLNEIAIAGIDSAVVWQGADLFANPSPEPYHDYTSPKLDQTIYKVVTERELKFSDGTIDLDTDGKGDLIFANAGGTFSFLSGDLLPFNAPGRQFISETASGGYNTFIVTELALDADIDILSDANADGVPEIIVGRQVNNFDDTALHVVSGLAVINATAAVSDLQNDESGSVVALENAPYDIGLGFSTTADYEDITSNMPTVEDVYLPLLTQGLESNPRTVPGEPQAYLLRGDDISAAFAAGETRIDLKSLFDGEVAE